MFLVFIFSLQCKTTIKVLPYTKRENHIHSILFTLYLYILTTTITDALSCLYLMCKKRILIRYVIMLSVYLSRLLFSRTLNDITSKLILNIPKSKDPRNCNKLSFYVNAMKITVIYIYVVGISCHSQINQNL